MCIKNKLRKKNFSILTSTNLLILIFCFAYIFICCSAQEKPNFCSSQTTCSDCIQQGTCVWCVTQKNSTMHCIQETEKTKCESNKIENPKSEVLIVKKDPTSIISPTLVNLKVRSKQMQNLKFTFTQPKNFPVDLYFLMDISYTMRHHRNSLASLASEIIVTMKNFSSDVRMGFGSFVDKPIRPFAFTDDAGNLKNPCPSEFDCNLPYSFKNHLSLTTDTSDFSLKVNTTKSSGNVDTPEGSLEALLQAIVCKKEIGWRENARRLIILSTDATFHIAGDGKLAGIDIPNDGLCHLNRNDYTHSLKQDYPSIGQISQKIKENDVMVIFAVTKSVKSIFEKLRDRIHSSYIGILSTEDTILHILQDILDNITNTVNIEHDFGHEFNIKFASKCEKFNRVNASCPVKPGDSISFTASIELVKCPKNLTKSNYKIRPRGLDKHISIEVDYLCECECEQTGEKQSPSCSDIGEYQCGICKCPSGKIGVSCECDSTAILRYDSSWNINNCMSEHSSDICSGAGYCNCGQCVCDRKTEAKDRIYGKYCECNDKSCYDDTDAVCSNHGTCSCGICECDPDWDGPKCECPKSMDTCKPLDSGDVCSGNGDCVCGKCACKTRNGFTFFGDYCETCLNCPQCNNFGSCVECKLFKQGIYNETQCEEKCAHCKIEAVDDVAKIEENESCSFRDDNGCLIKYKFGFDVEDPEITLLYVQREKEECAVAASLAYWAGIPILSILAATLIALAIFKLVSILQYRQEYAKFIQERELERNEMNPLYKSPNQRIENPLYGRD